MWFILIALTLLIYYYFSPIPASSFHLLLRFSNYFRQSPFTAEVLKLLLTFSICCRESLIYVNN